MTAGPGPDGAPLGRTLMAGTVSVVIGGSAGIGLAAAWALARHGSAVELAAIDPPGVDRAAAEMRDAGHEARGTVLDVADPGQIASFMAGVADRHGRLSVLVNSAGIQRYGTAETTPVSVWDEVLDVNVRGMFLAAGQAVPLMRRSGGGAIVNVASAQATATQRNVVAYTASKGAIVAMTRAMAVDHAPEPRGEVVQTFIPGHRNKLAGLPHHGPGNGTRVMVHAADRATFGARIAFAQRMVMIAADLDDLIPVQLDHNAALRGAYTAISALCVDELPGHRFPTPSELPTLGSRGKE